MFVKLASNFLQNNSLTYVNLLCHLQKDTYLVFITTLAQALKGFQSYVYVHAAYSVTDH